MVNLPVYLDNAATTPVAGVVLEAMQPYLLHHFGNSSSAHVLGKEAARAVGQARDQVLKQINGIGGRLVFTSCATESINTILKSFLPLPGQKPVHIITSAIEHKAVLGTCSYLQQFGCEITCLPVSPTGIISAELVQKHIQDNTALVCIQWVNNELGTIQPIAEIGKICRENGLLFMVDGVQAAGKLTIDVVQNHIDFLVISAHKFYGPKGVAAHYVGERAGEAIKPLLHGGDQENKLRSGTQNVAGIVGLTEAFAYVNRNLEAQRQRINRLRKHFVNKVQAEVAGVKINGVPGNCIPNIISLSIDGVSNRSLIKKIKHHVCISVGSACHAGSTTDSHVLCAIGLTTDAIRNTIRLSLGFNTTQAELDYVIQELSTHINQLRLT